MCSWDMTIHFPHDKRFGLKRKSVAGGDQDAQKNIQDYAKSTPQKS